LSAIIHATRTNLGCLLTVAELLAVQIWQDCVYEKKNSKEPFSYSITMYIHAD